MGAYYSPYINPLNEGRAKSARQPDYLGHSRVVSGLYLDRIISTAVLFVLQAGLSRYLG